MGLEQYKDTPDYQKIHQQLETLGLVEHAHHLDEYGYVVIPPELVAPEAFQNRLREAVLALNERRTGQKIRFEDIESTRLNEDVPANSYWAILEEDPVFAEAIMNPTVLAMAKYLCGDSVILGDLLCLLKQKHERLTHPLHTDQHGTPPPLPPYAQVANVTWTLTEYTKESGPTAIVPKSHLKGRYPTTQEGNFLREDAPVKAIPVVAPAGSLIVWHGCTWHGSFLRETAGLRLNLIMVFMRVYMQQIRDFRNETSKALLDSQSEEFARLIGVKSPYPFKDGQVAAPDDMTRMIRAGYNPYS